MVGNKDIIYEAIAKLEDISNLKIEIDSSRKSYDAIISINNIQFVIEVKTTIRNSNLGLILSQLEEKKCETTKPLIVISNYISKDSADKLKELNYNYIDTAGNAVIRNDNILIYISGQKKTKVTSNQNRAFQEVGVKILFYLMSKESNLQDSYRKIANSVGVSLGSVSNVMTELEDLNFLIKTGNQRYFKRKETLLDRWIVAYNSVLRPRILRTKMKFIDTESKNNWKTISDDKIQWGGEPAASILTGKLKPDQFIIYSTFELSYIARTLRLVPDPKGSVEIREMFWAGEEKDLVPPLLIYTDLINSGLGRNIELAKEIFKNELQYLK